MREFLLFPVEVKRFFVEPRNAAIFPMAMFVPILSLWPYFASPLVPALCAAFMCIEPNALNMWGLWPQQFEGLAIRPMNWKRTIAAKNAATIILLLGIFTLFLIITYFFHTGRIATHDILNGELHCLIAGIGLCIFGNSYSIVSPRGHIGWTLTDAGAALLAALIGGAAIVPAVVATALTGPISGTTLVLALYITLWVTWSLPRSSERLQSSIPELWMNTQTS
jgi:hypothetical protein